jgi:ppGpp synthetase/RelA/SpoT-type nucleotidyltranferase/predicted NUDIX family NTP pyrophosphohydrolase
MKNSVSLLIRDSLGRFLVIERGGDSKHFQGWWEFPGGKIDAGESPHTSVIRETQEEVGLSATPDTNEPVWRVRVPDGSVEYAFFTWHSPDANLSVKLSAEHTDYRWVTPTEAWKLQLLPTHREFMERAWHQDQLRAYEKLQPRYVVLQQTLEKVLNRLRKEWSPLAIVQARAKSVSSFAEKCLRKREKYDDPANQLTDLCGGRVIATTLDEAETICRQIRSLFSPVDEDDDTRSRHSLSAFGYLSVHFIVHFRADQKEVLGVPIPPQVAGLKAEIQVRTLLQHAHSEVTHDRLYKGGFKAPAHCEREAARVAAMLEEADDTFARFVHKLDVYVGHYAAHMEPTIRQREQDNLRLVMAHEPDPANKPALALRLARLARAAWDWPGVVAALEPFSNTPCIQQLDVQMELGNALCRLHRDTPTSPEHRHGLNLLAAVAQPEAASDFPVEAHPRQRRAAALAWLGSALGKTAGHRSEARKCLSKAVLLAPDDPYHLTAFVELDVVASSTDEHLALLAPALHQAAGRCEQHIHAGIEVTRAWLTLSKIRLLLGEETGAFEALCIASRAAENAHPLADFQRSLDHLEDAIGTRLSFINILNQTALLLVGAKENAANPAEQRLPLVKQFDYAGQSRVLILAGSTAADSDSELRQVEPHLKSGLQGFAGCLLTGGTDAGVCALAARVVADLQAKGAVQLIGYLPQSASASPAFKQVVRTARTNDFSALEPIQMWVDLLASGVLAKDVTLLCLGGGQISSQELALAWALGARSVAVDDEKTAPQRFGALLKAAGSVGGLGMVLPNDPATLTALIAFNQPVDARRWEKAGMAAHQAYLEERSKHPTQSNLVAWPLLRDDFKESNRHQAACSADILRKAGFEVVPSELPASEIPLPEFTSDDIEPMAEMEHGRWNVERLNSGWRYGEKKDEERKVSPYLVSWQNLPETVKVYDRQAVQTWPRILAQAGLQVRKLG